MTTPDLLETHLTTLNLHHIHEQYQPLAKLAADKQWSCIDYLARLVEGEAHERETRSIERRIRNARFVWRQLELPVVSSKVAARHAWPAVAATRDFVLASATSAR